MHYLYLHGFCSGADSFKGSYFRERFAEQGRTLHTPDLNGDDFEHLTMTGQLALIRELAASLPGKLTVLGSSMGAYLAALFAEEEPRVSRLVMIAPAFGFAARREAELDPGVLETWREKGYLEIYHYAYQKTCRLHYGILDDARQYDRRSLQRRLPALPIHGLRDDSVDYRLSIDYLEHHPGAELLLLNGDHTLTDEVGRLWSHLRRFLDL